MVEPEPEPEPGPGPLYSRVDIVDHTDHDVFTIDPAGSKDYDDALSVDVAQNTVYVHIVDIAHAELTKEEEARLKDRCLTLYLANEYVEHLLNPVTASDRLSLIVGSPRATITIKLVLSEGKVVHYEIYRSVIRVARRYTYEEVATLLASNTAPAALYYLDRLAAQRSFSVNYNLALPSARLTVDQTGLATEIRMEDTQDSAHQLVATAMILANLTVSKHLDSRGLVLPNRFHAALRGLPLTDRVSTGNIVVDSFIRVKTFARARYTVDEKGHFGLGLTDYVHFTSPMRRYADVLVHRLLAGHQIPDLEEQVNYINYRSLVVRRCQELYERWKIARYLATLPGPHLIYVTGIAKAGVQWFMPSLSLNGFCHVSCLEPAQYWSLSNDRLQGATTSVEVGKAYTALIKSIDPITSVVQLLIRIN